MGWPLARSARRRSSRGRRLLAVTSRGRGYRYRSTLVSPHNVALVDLVAADVQVVVNSVDSLSGWISLLECDGRRARRLPGSTIRFGGPSRACARLRVSGGRPHVRRLVESRPHRTRAAGTRERPAPTRARSVDTEPRRHRPRHGVRSRTVSGSPTALVEVLAGDSVRADPRGAADRRLRAPDDRRLPPGARPSERGVVSGTWTARRRARRRPLPGARRPVLLDAARRYRRDGRSRSRARPATRPARGCRPNTTASRPTTCRSTATSARSCSTSATPTTSGSPASCSGAPTSPSRTSSPAGSRSSGSTTSRCTRSTHSSSTSRSAGSAPQKGRGCRATTWSSRPCPA